MVFITRVIQLLQYSDNQFISKCLFKLSQTISPVFAYLVVYYVWHAVEIANWLQLVEVTKMFLQCVLLIKLPDCSSWSLDVKILCFKYVDINIDLHSLFQCMYFNSVRRSLHIHSRQYKTVLLSHKAHTNEMGNEIINSCKDSMHDWSLMKLI